MNNSIMTGVQFMVIGMGSVLLFLAFLVLITNVMHACMSRLDRLFPEKKTEAPSAQGENLDQIAAAVASAFVLKK